MVGRLFGSPTGGGGGGGLAGSSAMGIPPQPLNTPKSQSRRERIEQARQEKEKSRRRNFGFLKAGLSSSNDNKRMTTSAITRRREHAKQLANLAYSDDPTGDSGDAFVADFGGGAGGGENNYNNYNSGFDNLTPTSRYAHQQLLSSFDVDSPQNDGPLDPFSTIGSLSSKKNNGGRKNKNNNSVFFDPHNVVAAGSSAPATDREPTASTVDTFDNSSLGSAAFDMDFIAAAAATTTTATTNMNSHHSPMSSSIRSGASSSTNNNKKRSTNTSLDNFFVESNNRNTISMPTVPSNSTMQANYHRQQTSSSTNSVVSNQSGSNSSIGAAARRRMRSHMKSQKGSNGIGSSNSSVGSHQNSSNTAGVTMDAFSVDGNASYDASSFMGGGSSALHTPPESPASTARSNSIHRSNSNLSATKNRLTAYQQRSNSNSFNQSSSFISGHNSVASSTNSASSPGLFDSDKLDGGFTFDAFGLDQSQVEREVNEAVQELAGQGLSGFSMFVVDKTASNRSLGRGKDSIANQSDDDTFTPQNWDSSPMSSRNNSPVPSHYNYNSDNGNEFVDGFRVAKPNTTTAQLTPNTNSFAAPSTPSSAARRLQRSLKRGAVTNVQSMPPKPFDQQQRQNTNNVTPPRWQSSPRPSSPGVNNSPAAVFQGPVVSNPWKEDPWASDDGGNAGSGSDFFSVGDTQSDVQDYRLSYGSAASGGNNSRRLSTYSDAKSDVGVSMASRMSHPSFYQLPPEEPHYSRSSPGTGIDDEDDKSDDSDDMSQMQEDLTREFAKDLVRRISPSNNFGRDGQTQRILHQAQHDQDPRSKYEQSASQPAEEESDQIQSDPDFSDYASSDYASPPVKPFERSPINKSRFTSFRSKYESTTTRGNAPGVPSESSSHSVSTSYRARNAFQSGAANELSSNQSSNRTYRGQFQSASESKVASEALLLQKRLQRPNLHRNRHRFDRQRNNTLILMSKMSVIVQKRRKMMMRLPNAVTSPTPKVGSLKARWEAQSRMRSNAENSAKTEPSRPVVQRSDKTRESIGMIDNSFEMLTPDIVEARRQQKQKEKIANLRKSMGVVDREFSPKAAQSAKSDVGGSRLGPSVTDRILERVRQESPRNMLSTGHNHETKSDGGSTPSFLANVKLRKVTSPPTTPASVEKDAELTSPSSSRPLSYRERRSLEVQRKVTETQDRSIADPTPEKPVERKLTYRERRELELQREQEEKARGEPANEETPKKDVASLIRKRIAANKQKNVSGGKDSASEDLSNIRGRLKPVEKENVSQEEVVRFDTPSPQHAASPSNRNSLGSQHRRMSLDQSVQAEEQSIDVKASPASNILASKSQSMYKTPEKSPSRSSPMKSPGKKLDQLFASKEQGTTPRKNDAVPPPVADVRPKVEIPDDVSQADVKSMLSSFLGARAPPALPLPAKEDDTEALKKHHVKSPQSTCSRDDEESPPPPPPPSYKINGSIPALKDDPKFERYFRMLKMGLPLEVAKHAMVRDGLDPSVLDLDPNKPVGVPLKEDPKFDKYFKMLKIGISMDQVKHAMERDDLNPAIMDQDHNLPVITVEKKQEKKPKETHRRARLHWKTIGKVVRNSLWAKVEDEVTNIDIDEEEFNELFKADLKDTNNANKTPNSAKKKGAAVRVIDAKRANNGGIILARLKMTHDEMADAVDRIDSDVLSAEQIENIIEYLPTKEEREALEKYMLEGGQDAAEKFDGLCECEKFMVSMMTVKHAKRKIRALLFKLQFMSCMESIAEDAQTIDNACDELIHSNRLRQLLGIILQFGNRLNTAGVNSKRKAGAFTLDSLSKLREAKAFDKKTTFLHYIILIVQRNNELLLKYYDDLPTVLKADKVFWDQCLQDLEEVENQLENVRRISLYEARMKKQYKLRRGNDSGSDDDSLGDMELSLEEEVESLRATPTGLFTLGAIKQVSALRDKIDRTKSKFKRVLEYFGEDINKMQPHELFSIISTFTRDFQKAKDEVFSTVHKRLREDRKKARNQTPNQTKGLPPAGPDRTPTKPMLRASDHQPNMSSLFNEIQKRGSGENSNVTPSLRNMQYQPEIPEETPSPSSQTPSPTAAASANDTLRQKALQRHRNYAPASNDGSSSKMALAPQMKSFSNNDLPPSSAASNIRSPRDALRNRRRLEAMRSRYPAHSSPSPGNNM